MREHRDIVFGEKGKVGLLDWLEHVVEQHYEGEKEVKVYSTSLYKSDKVRKGKFPSVQIYPDGDEFERYNDRTLMHEITVNLAVSTKGPEEEAFKESSRMAEELYDELRNLVPRLKGVQDPPLEGSIDYAWEGFHRKKHRNVQLSHAMVQMVYKFRS